MDNKLLLLLTIVLSYVYNGSVIKDELLEDMKISSPNGVYDAFMQNDGNFVIYHDKSPKWQTLTYDKGNGPFKMIMQQDGNLVIYSGTTSIWASNSIGKGVKPYKAQLDNTGILSILDSNNDVIWNTEKLATGHQILQEEVLKQGSYLLSENEKYRIYMQDDGNLVLYDGSVAIWSSNSENKSKSPPFKAVMRLNGNLVIFDSKMNAIWNSQTIGRGSGPYKAVLQDDRNFVIYSGTTSIFATHTTPMGASLENDQSLFVTQELISKNQKCLFKVQRDGNVVLYDDGKALWSFDTNDSNRVVMQSDGNLVSYDKGGNPVWSSHSQNSGTGPYRLVLEDNCILIIFDSYNKNVWDHKNGVGGWWRWLGL